MRIFLTGMMGSGKSFWAKKIATLGGFECVDLDDYIEQKLGLQIETIFRTNGAFFFREIEAACLVEIIHKYDHCMVATGGGTPCFHNNLKVMKSAGKVVYLKTDLQTLANRIITSRTRRPIIQANTMEELMKELLDIFNAREQFYEQSDEIVDMNQCDKTNFAEIFLKDYV